MTLTVNKVEWCGLNNTTHCIYLAKNKIEAALAIEGRYIIYLAVATRWSASVIKVSVQTCSDAFNPLRTELILILRFSHI